MKASSIFNAFLWKKQAAAQKKLDKRIDSINCDLDLVEIFLITYYGTWYSILFFPIL
jgi:hypothetical protein